MAAESPTAWARLSFFEILGSLFVAYEDSRGKSVRPPVGAAVSLRGWKPVPLDRIRDVLRQVEAGGVWWSTAATGYLFELAQRMPLTRQGRRGAAPVPVAVLIVPPANQPAAPAYERITHELIEMVGLSQARYSIAFEAVASGDVGAFKLPLNVAYVTDGVSRFRGFIRDLLAGLSPAELEHAVRIETPSARELQARSSDFDVVVTSATELPWMGATAQGGPRLLIVDDVHLAEQLVQRRSLPHGTSLVGLPSDPPWVARDVVEGIFRGFTHDLPLHEAVAAAGHDLGLSSELRSTIRLFTSSSGLDAIRLGTAYRTFEEGASELYKYRGIESLSPNVTRSGRPLQFPRIREAVEKARFVTLDFRRESGGLTEMARAEAARQAAADELAVVRALGSQLADDRDRMDDLARSQRRRVTIWLAHAADEWEPERVPELATRTRLAGRRRYVLNVGVGIDWPTDLVDAGAPPLDPLLPATDSDQRTIDVVVFTDHVKVLDGNSRELPLPRVGPCGPVTFTIETPARRRRARLRVALYYRRHMLQAFELNMTLADEEAVLTERVLRADLVFSRLTEIREVDEIPERLLSVAANADVGHGSHSFMFSTGDKVSLSEKLVADMQEFFRGKLRSAFDNARKSGVLSSAQFSKLIKELASKGREVRQHLYDNASEELQDQFTAVKKEAGRVIQVIRLEPELAFPWAMIYDWNLPATAGEFDKAPICAGLVDGMLCTCTAETGGHLCVRGFWGIRHIIEEFVRNGDSQDHIPSIEGPEEGPAVLCTVGVKEDHWSAGIASTLSAAWGSASVEDFQAGHSLYSRMRDPQQRPAVLVVVGHLTTQRVTAELDAPRIYIKAAEKYLDTYALGKEREDHGRWKRPHRSIVLLLACNSGEDALGKMHSFVAGFASAGASAVIATEQRIDSRLAASLASGIVPALKTTGPGASLREWRADLLTTKNPFGFLFTCFGCGDVTVAGGQARETAGVASRGRPAEGEQ